jgi:hypothetical protein
VKQLWLGGLSALTIWLGVASATAAAEISLTVSTPSALAERGTAQTQVRIGTVTGATSGFDTRWDVPAPPTPSNGLVTLSAGVVPSLPPSDQPILLWDFREGVFPQTWVIDVTSDQTAPVTLSAQTAGDDNACAPVEWTFEDTYSGTRVNLNASASYAYQYMAPAPRTRRFIVTAETPLAQQPPSVPRNLWSPRQGRASVYLAWSGAGDPAIRYHVYRDTGQGSARLTSAPIAATSYVDTGIPRTDRVTYHVSAVAESGCESERSSALAIAPHR